MCDMERTIPEAAKEIGISRQAFHKAIDRQEVLVVVRIGGRLAVTEAQFVKFKALVNGRSRRGPKPNTNGKKKGS